MKIWLEKLKVGRARANNNYDSRFDCFPLTYFLSYFPINFPAYRYRRRAGVFLCCGHGKAKSNFLYNIEAICVSFTRETRRNLIFFHQNWSESNNQLCFPFYSQFVCMLSCFRKQQTHLCVSISFAIYCNRSNFIDASNRRGE